MNVSALADQLCRVFCEAISVRAVPSGLAISGAFKDRSGDPILFYLVEDGDEARLEDDGAYLAHLVARDIPIEQGQRGQLLDAMLAEAEAHWDRETYEIRSTPFPEAETAQRVVAFLSALLRVRDLELLTRDVVRSTFREDAVAALAEAFGSGVEIIEDVPVDKEFSEFPADIVIRPRESGRPGAVYLVTSNDKLNEALLLHQEAMSLNRTDVSVIALMEDADLKAVSRRRFQRAQNRGLAMPIFRGDEQAAMRNIARNLGISAPVASAQVH